MQGRNQQVVDLTNPQAYEYVYGCMDALVTTAGSASSPWITVPCAKSARCRLYASTHTPRSSSAGL